MSMFYIRSLGVSLLIFFLGAGVCFAQGLSAQGLSVGDTIPDFKIRAGDGKRLTREMIEGKVIVIFYETKNVGEKNRTLKDTLNAFYDDQIDDIKEQIIRLPVVNCTKVFWPLTGLWNMKLRQRSREKGMRIYGDWDGKMASSYKMIPDESNVLIIDRKAVVRYCSWGDLNAEVDTIKQLLDDIVFSNDGVKQ